MKSKGFFHHLLRFLKWTGIAFASVVILLVIAVFVLIEKPEILLNPRTLKWGADYADRHDLAHVKWDQAALRVESLSFLKKRLLLDFSGLCMVQAVPDIHACFKTFHLSAAADFSRFPPKLSEVGPFNALGGAVKVKLEPESEKKKEEAPQKKSGGSGLPSWLGQPHLGPMRVEIPRWEFEQPGTHLAGAFDFRGDDLNDHPTISLDLKGTDETTGATQLQAMVRAHNEKGFWRTEGWDSHVQAKGRLPHGLRAALDARLLPRLNPEPGLEFTAETSYDQGRKSARASWSGALSNQRIRVELLRGEGDRLLDAIPFVSVANCAVEIRRAGLELSSSTLGVNCPLKFRVPLPPQNLSHFKIPTTLGVRITADMKNSTYIPGVDSVLDGPLEIQVDPILTPLFEGNLGAKSMVHGKVAEFPKFMDLTSQLAIRIAVPDFRKVVAEMEKTAWAVPAPLAVLQGSVVLQGGGNFDLAHGPGTFAMPIQFKTALQSKTQRVNTQVNGQLQTSWQDLRAGKKFVKLQIGAMISDVQLQLPRLELAAPPRFFPDGRFHDLAREEIKQATAESAVDLSYRADIRTPDENPLKIITNLANAPVPVDLKIHLDQAAPVSGNIDVRDFPVELFRRKATVDHFSLKLQTPAKDSVVDGLIRVAYTDYTITVHLSGTTQRTHVKLSSDPPLPEDQLYAALLFGAPPGDLDADQMSSVGNAQTAFAGGAVSLASLYLLSSTPIQSISYDPGGKKFTAKVKLAAGTSLNLGGDPSELSSVGVRTRLGPHWAITTGVNRQADTDPWSASAFLAWTYRY